MYDVIVIGAGPAGLQTALTLGRMHRSVLVLDSGEYRNGPVAHMHNVVGNDGTPPAEFRASARAQLAAYGDIEMKDAAATRVTGERDDFTVELADGTSERARRIVLATASSSGCRPRGTFSRTPRAPMPCIRASSSSVTVAASISTMARPFSPSSAEAPRVQLLSWA